MLTNEVQYLENQETVLNEARLSPEDKEVLGSNDAARIAVALVQELITPDIIIIG